MMRQRSSSTRPSKQNIDLIAMASTGRGALGRLTLGSVADRVVRTADRPVLVVRGTTLRPRTNCLNSADHRAAGRLGPLDAGHSGRSDGLEAVAGAGGAVDGGGPAAGGLAGDGVWAGLLARVLRRDRRADDANADEYLDRRSPSSVSTAWTRPSTSCIGSAVAAILDFAKPGDLIVMTSRGQGGFKRWFLGSVAEKLVRDAPAPVLLVPSHHHE